MYKRVSGVKFLLLPYITCGIYAIVVWARLSRQQNRMAESVGQKRIIGVIPAILLGCVTFGIVPIVWMFKFFAQMARLNREKDAGISPSNGFLMLLMSCIPLFSFFWLAGAHNKLVKAYTVTEE